MNSSGTSATEDDEASHRRRAAGSRATASATSSGCDRSVVARARRSRALEHAVDESDDVVHDDPDRDMISPATTIALSVAPERSRTTAAATSDSGIVTSAMSAARQSKSSAPSMSAISRTADHQRQGDVADRCVDERRRAEHGRVDVDAGQAGLHRGERRLHVARHLEGVGVRELLDDQDEPVAVLDDAHRRSAAGGPRRLCATSPSVSARGVGPSIDRDLRRSSGDWIGRMCWMPRRWFGVSMNPPVPGVDASRNVSGETHRALPAVSMTCSSLTRCWRSRRGSTSTWSWRSRWPQIATLATPGTPISRGRIVQRASTDMSISDLVGRANPTIMKRLATTAAGA